jgi:hypothetical protein
MGCENLATKQDIQSLSSKLDQVLDGFALLATKADIETVNQNIAAIDLKLDTILNNQSSITSLLNQSNSKLDEIIDNLTNSDGSNIWDVLINLIRTLGDSLDNLVSELANIVNNAIHSSQVVITSTVENVADTLLGVIHSSQVVITSTVESTAGVLNNAIDSVENTIVTTVETTGSVINNAIDSAENVIVTTIETTGSVINNAIDSAENVIVTTIETTGSVLETAITSVASVVNNIVDEIAGIINNIVDEIVQGITSVINNLVDEIVQGVTSVINNFIDEIAGIINNIVDEIVQGITSVINNLVDEIIQGITSVINNLVDEIVQGITSLLNNLVDEIVQGITSLLNNLVDEIVAGVTVVVRDIVAELPGILNHIVDELTDIINATSQLILSRLFDILQGIIPELIAEIRAASQDVRDWIGNQLTNIIDRILDLLSNPDDTNLKAIEDLLKDIVQLASEILDILTPEEGEEETESLAEKIQKIYERLGVDQYPVTVPVSLTGTDTSTTKINSITQFQSWQTKQLYNMIGRYPIKIKVSDSDLVKTGNQSVDLEFPNLAETLAEIMGILILMNGKDDALMTIGLKTLAEVGSTRKQTIIDYRLTQAIASYLGFKTKQKSENIEFLFNPLVGSDGNPESLARALTNSTQSIKVEEEDEERTLEQKLIILVEAARIIKGRFFQKMSDKNLDSWIQGIKDLATAADSAGEDFDSYIEKVERGFIDEAGITDQLHPYGRNFDQRPRIREIGNQQED